MGQPRNRFSSCCGEPFADAQYPRQCTACDNLYWDNPIPVIVVLQPVIRADGTVGLVMIQRAIQPALGGWALPGGFVEVEDWRVAGEREIEEEGAGDIDADKLVPFAPHPYESTPDGRRILMFCTAEPIREQDLPPFTANRETSDRKVIWKATESCFSIHTEAIRLFFETQATRAAA